MKLNAGLLWLDELGDCRVPARERSAEPARFLLMCVSVRGGGVNLPRGLPRGLPDRITIHA